MEQNREKSGTVRRRGHRRRKKSRRQRIIAYTLRALCVLVPVLIVGLTVMGVRHFRHRTRQPLGWPSYVTEKLLTVNSSSRPAIRMGVVRNIVIHEYSEPGITADGRRNYYESLKDNKDVHESSHLIIGSDGKVILCVPVEEICYAADEKNTETISIEYLTEQPGSLIPEMAYQHLVDLAAWLCLEYNIPSDQVIRHYDINGRDCPAAYVTDETQWHNVTRDIRSAYTEWKRRQSIDE